MATIQERKGRNGVTVYRVRVRVKGHPVQTKTFARKTDAKAWAQSQEETLRAVQAFGSSAYAKRPLSELIDRYIAVELPKHNTNRDYTRTQLMWWRNEIGDTPLKDVSPALLGSCRDKLSQEKHTSHKYGAKNGAKRKAPATVLRYMMALSHVFTVACKEWGWLSVNPMANVKKPSKLQKRVRFLDDDERARLLDACSKSECKYLLPVVVIALSTGARYNEIMSLRWRDVDLERGVARLEKTKNGERRALPLTHKALEAVQQLHDAAHPDRKSLLFGRSDGLAPMAIQKYWKSALDEAGIDDFRFHDLRHCAASYLAMNGATLAEIAEVLGHKTLQMVKRYAHLSDQHTASVVERMNRKIFAANDNAVPTRKKAKKGR